MNELEQLKAIAEHLEAIRCHSTAGTLADLSEWLYNEFPKMLPLIDSAMQYTAEILEYNAEMDRPYKQLQLNAEMDKFAAASLRAG